MPTEDSLHVLEEQVCDESSFVAFLEALAADREREEGKEAVEPAPLSGRAQNGWENGTIASFLGAATAWAVSSKNGTELFTPAANPWRRCAEILHAGKFYE